MNMSMKIYSVFTVLVALLIVTSCTTDPQSPGVEYMPDMYRTPALEPYSGNSNYADSMEARLPAEGSIPRGYLPYGIPNTNEGYELAGATLKSPFSKSEEITAEGKEIYKKFCLHCHGKEGIGDGPTVTAGGHPPPPAYDSQTLKNLPEGKMFHTITYGKNLMGPHASQLNTEERWKVIQYVQTLQGNDEVSEETESEETAEDIIENAESADESASSETEMNN